MDSYKETQLRNTILGNIYGSLPGYACFDVNDIEKESIENRKKWFDYFNEEKYLKSLDSEIIEDMVQMINILNSEN